MENSNKTVSAFKLFQIYLHFVQECQQENSLSRINDSRPDGFCTGERVNFPELNMSER